MQTTEREVAYSQGYEDGVKDTIIKVVIWLVAVICSLKVTSFILGKLVQP